MLTMQEFEIVLLYAVQNGLDPVKDYEAILKFRDSVIANR